MSDEKEAALEIIKSYIKKAIPSMQTRFLYFIFRENLKCDPTSQRKRQDDNIKIT